MSDGWAGLAPPVMTQDPDHQALARAVARMLATPDGKLVWEHLQDITLGRVLGPDASDARLRSLEGQRALVFHLQTLARHGRDF